MKRILIVTIAYRVGERIYPIIPELAKDYTIDVLRIYQMHPDFKWPGTYDMRLYFEEQFNKYFNKIFFNKEDINYSDYSLIIYDDCRINNGGDWIYKQAKCPVISCSHGNGDNMYLHNIHKVYDKLFLFGKQEVTEPFIVAAGIPSNDKLFNYKNIDKKHILIIVNFLEHHQNVPFKKSNQKFFNTIDLIDLQKTYNKEIIIKLKSRYNNGSVSSDRDFLSKVLPKELNYKVVVDTIDDNLLIAQSEVVIGAPSTLMVKPLQLKIPTAMIKGYGQIGIFKNYNGLVELNKEDIRNALQYKITDDYISNLVEGGVSFNSTKVFIDNIKCLL
jgi:hypothetical protein